MFLIILLVISFFYHFIYVPVLEHPKYLGSDTVCVGVSVLPKRGTFRQAMVQGMAARLITQITVGVLVRAGSPNLPVLLVPKS